MRIEIMYPELCCLYGDKGNTMFLQQCLPEAEFIFTQLNDRPHFLDEEIDLCCMYSMSEQSQERILSRLLQWKTEILEKLAGNTTLFLFTGNSLELLGQYIEREDGSRQECLGLFDTYAKRHAPQRFNTLIQADFENMTLLGYTSRFSDTYGLKEELAMCHVTIGSGMHPESKLEGIRQDRIIATYMLGPLLVANPDFSKWLLQQLGVKTPVLPFEEALYQGYETRRKEFQRPDLELD